MRNSLACSIPLKFRTLKQFYFTFRYLYYAIHLLKRCHTCVWKTGTWSVEMLANLY